MTCKTYIFRRSVPAALLVVLFVSPLASDAQQATCDVSGITVTAPTEPDARTVCQTISAALPRLQACHLNVQHPLRVTVSDDLPGVGPQCLGYYQTDRSEIFIRTAAGMVQSINPQSAFSRIDPPLLFESIVVHELAHALFQQSSRAADPCTEDHEYVAYGMQMAWLPGDQRAQIIAPFGVDAPVDPMMLNAFVAAMAPDRYAALVWQHFSQPENGCAFIHRLLAGQTSLHLEIYPE